MGLFSRHVDKINPIKPFKQFPHNNSRMLLSKDYLSQLPAKKTELIADQIYKSMIADVFNAALTTTSYTYDLVKAYVNENYYMHPMARKSEKTFTETELPQITDVKISTEDLVVGLQAKFPGCKVSYVGGDMPDYTNRETLGHATHAAMQPGYVVPNGILIDWS